MTFNMTPKSNEEEKGGILRNTRTGKLGCKPYFSESFRKDDHALMRGEMNEQQLTAEMKEFSGYLPPSSDARGYFIPHLSKLDPTIRFAPEFWTSHQFFTRGDVCVDHIKQLKAIPKQYFRSIRKICLDFGMLPGTYIPTFRCERAINYCIKEGHPDLAIKLLWRVHLTRPGLRVEDPVEDCEACLDHYPGVPCRYDYEPAIRMLEWQQRFQKEFGDRVKLITRVSWTEAAPTSGKFVYSTEGEYYFWRVNEYLYEIDPTTHEFLWVEPQDTMISPGLRGNASCTTVDDLTQYELVTGDPIRLAGLLGELKDLAVCIGLKEESAKL